MTAPNANFAPRVYLTNADLSLPEIDTLNLDPFVVDFSEEETAALGYTLLDRDMRTFTTGMASVNVRPFEKSL